MNILFIIGNGFDLNLGLETSYGDFYEWYLESYDSRKQNVVDFINKINEKKPYNKLWSCMELALGEYTSYLSSENIVNEYTELHDNLIEAMSAFIKGKEATLDISKISQTLFNQYFISPESYADLKPNDTTYFHNLRQNSVNRATSWGLNIMSFNYSNSLEKITGFEVGAEVGAFYKNSTGKIKINRVEHIHGTTDDRLIIGVNSQLLLFYEGLHSQLERHY